MPSTEANASVTYSITSKSGFNILFTLRDENGINLLNKMDSVEPELLKRGYIPQIKKSFGGGEKKPLDIVPDRKCPTCGKDLVYQTLSSGKKMIKCSTQKYDFATKTTTGCEYKEWLD